MTLIKFNSDKKNNVLMPGIDNVFDSIINDTFFSDRMISRVPAANISESEDRFHIELAAPGLNKEDFKITLDRNVLNISVEQHSGDEQQTKSYSKREYSYSSFVRSFTLPDSADENGIDAQYNNGVLNIDIPKHEASKSQGRQIEIK